MSGSDGSRRTILATLVVAGVPLLILATRLVLEAAAGGRAWFLVTFLSMFAAARLVGARVALVAAGGTALLTLLGFVTRGPDPTRAALVADAAVDAATGVIAVALAMLARSAMHGEGARRDQAARTMRSAEAAIAREAAVRELAEELAAITSPRQIADSVVRRFATLFEVQAAAVVVPEDSDLWVVRDDAGLGASPQLAERGEESSLEMARAAAFESLTGSVVRLERDGPHVRLGVPLHAGSAVAGGAGLVLLGSPVLDEDTQGGLLTLGRIAGEALARSAEQRRARRSAEREELALERVGRLQRLASDLARPLEADAAAAVVVDAASAGVSAPVVVFHRVIAARDRLELLAARGYPGGLLAGESRLPLDAELPAAEAARTGQVIAVAATDWTSRFPNATDVPAITGVRHLVAIPAGDRSASGVLVVARAGGTPFDADELGFLGTIAEQGAQAVERADLLDALRERGRRLDLTLGAARTGTWELDLESGVLSISDELRRVHGLGGGVRVRDLDGYLDRVHEDDRAAVRAAIGEVLQRPGDFAIEYRTVMGDGAATWISSVGRSFADETGRPGRVTATDRDVTLDRVAEAERERLLEQEREARRLQEAFVGVMSHELRTPITTILAGAQLLLRHQDLNAAARDLAQDVGDEAERLYRLVEDLLVLTRLERGNLAPAREPVHVGHLIERVVASEEGRWPTRSFRVVRPRGDEVVEGEDTYVEQVLRNLLSNGAKYSPAGSTVQVVVEHAERDVVVRVLDEGPGIAADEVGDLFTLFYRSPTTSAAASGAGIGLFVCDRLVRAMGGRIWARRRESIGSEFGFSLARYEDLDPPVHARPVAAAPAVAPGARAT